MLINKNKAAVITLLDFKQQYKVIVMKTVWYMCENTGTNEKELRACKINPCIYGQLVFDKGVMNTQWRKDSIFNKWS